MQLTESHLLKDLFAMALLRQPDNPFAAAIKVFGTDTGTALQVSHAWPHDQYVLARQAELLAEYGEEAFLPNKSELARKIFTMVDNISEDRDKIAALRLYADVRGFVDKQTAIAHVTNNTVVNRVMVMKDHGTDEEWEEKTSRQQALLIEHARD